VRTALAALALLACATLAVAQPVSADLCKSPEHHAFDFWIGRWTVTETKTGKPAGQSLIESLYDDCALRENWSEPGYAGGSLNHFDAPTGKWRQTWTDASGAWREFVGGIEDGKMVMTASVVSPRDPAKLLLVRMAFTPNPDGSVRQYSDYSRDNGKTWLERYDYTYRRAP
jgi:hypothetical protein